VDPRASLDDVEKRKFLTLPGLELQPLGRPAHSESLEHLCYPDSYVDQYEVKLKHSEIHNYIKIQKILTPHRFSGWMRLRCVGQWYMDPLSAWHGESSGCRWTRRPPAMKHYYKYTQ
jgi:hypothetical protein